MANEKTGNAAGATRAPQATETNPVGVVPDEVPLASPLPDWFARPVLHVTDVDTSLRFYVDRLGFTISWRYEEDGRAHVAQVERQSCVLILADNWPEKIGKGLMFISLNAEPREAALDALRAELESKGVSVKEGSWGYRVLVVDDPDGNQLFFNYPAETGSDKNV